MNSMFSFVNLSISVHLYSPVMNDWIGCLQEALAGLEDELSTLCQNYHWLDNVSSLIEKCKKDKIENMSAENFEVSLQLSA